ncbi:MAG TPA: cytochrome b/b6 domain-containing protein [Acetobacteraceae bacterium]|nr:cytochrome b/b6 domain-containing protein [Acetobacteraceae bacterium]
MSMQRTPAQGNAAVVWDLPTRLFHWLAVALVAAAYATWRLNWMDWHALAGDALLALLLFRLAWGFVGSDTARFARFLASPRAAAHHLARLFRREPDTQVGHNPAGGWMVLLMLVLLLGQTLTGIVVNNDVADAGPLTDIMPAPIANLVTDLHDLLWDALLAAIALHVAAIVIYALAKGHHLLRPMLTGRKPLPQGNLPPRLASPALALLVLCGSAAAAALLATFL